MEDVTAGDISDNLLNNAKIEVPTSCEQSIELVSKMEMTDNQSEVHLENSSSHLMEAQYLNLQRVSDLTKNLTNESIPSDLLSHHVVDLDSNPEYSQHVVTNAQFYDNSDFLSTNFSDEDRRLTAALVAVKFIQQNISNSPPINSAINAELLHDKTALPSVSSLSSEKVITPIVPNYTQAVDSRDQSNMSMHISNRSVGNTEGHLAKQSEHHDDQIIKLYQPLLQTVVTRIDIVIFISSWRINIQFYFPAGK